MVWREVVFLGPYGQISDPYAGFAIWEIYGFQPRNGDFARDILQKRVWREVVFLVAYGQIRDPYAGFAIWEIKNPGLFVYFTSTTAIGVSVSAM